MNGTNNQSNSDLPAYELGMALRKVYIWVLVAVGVPGNLACLLTILFMHMTTATIYVALLAATDSLALLLKLVFHQLITHRKLTAVSCYFLYVPSFFSCYCNWILALICFERFFAVCFPLKKQAYFSKRKVYISAAVLTLFLVIAFAPTFFLYEDVGPEGKRCILRGNMVVFKEQVWSAGLLGSLYFFIPFLLVAVFTTLIIIGLQRHRRARQAMMRTTRSGGGGGNDGGVERAISIMLLCAGLVFLLLTLPTCLFHLYLKKRYNLAIPEEKAQGYLLYQVITFLSDANHAVNFIIYFLSAAKFRSCFVELLKRCLCVAKCKKESYPCTSEDGTHLTDISHPNKANNDGVDSKDEA